MRHCWWLLWCWCGWLSCAPLTLVAGDYAPYSGANLPEGGKSTRLVTQMLRDAGYHDQRVTYLPWLRGYQLAINGLVTATYPYSRTAEREQDFYYSDPIHLDHLSWFTYRGSKAVFDGKWQGLTVCMPLGWSTSHLDVVVKRFGMILQSPKTLAQCLQLLVRHRVDLVTMNDAVMADASLQEFGDPCYLQMLPYYRETEPLYLIVSRRVTEGPMLLTRFNKALAAARTSGRYDELVQGAHGRRCKMWTG
ncbi:substrate-binding periplasmic protein [Aeromonas sp. MdU4]|uniref:substrate-binding periplasmic protein n=1 Tax=Aeromonas sp. MdU4 TaxID=3342819 RepID=UPI0035B93335